MKDKKVQRFCQELAKAIGGYQENISKMSAETPYGVPYRPAIWGAGWDIQSFAFRHYFVNKAFPGQTDKDVGTVDGFFQCVDICPFGGEETLLLVQVLTPHTDDALGVEHDDVFFLGTNSHIELGT